MNTQKLSAKEEIKLLKQKMEELKAQIPSKTFADKLTVKVGEKGNLVIYGLQKYPISLYSSQITRLIKLLNSTEFSEFVLANKEKLAKKEE